MADKLVDGLLYQIIIGRSGDKMSIWCAPAHFVEKPNRVPLAVRIVVDFSHLNSCRICDKAHVFTTGEKIIQQLGADCCVWICKNALLGYYQIYVAKRDQHKNTFMLNLGRFFFKKTVMGNLPGVYKLVNHLLIGARNYKELAERLRGG